MSEHLLRFMGESLRIEGIHREPTPGEMQATEHFLDLYTLTVEDVERLVAVYVPGKPLREREGMDVRVGRYVAPPGGPKIRTELARLLGKINGGQIDAYQ